MKSYGTAVVAVPVESRIPLLRKFVEHSRFMPVSSITRVHTGHPFGPEGYKTIAYELFLQLNATISAAVFVPTGYAELLFGIWKGFEEIRTAGLASRVPKMIACEPAARGPLTEALSTGHTVAEVARIRRRRSESPAPSAACADIWPLQDQVARQCGSPIKRPRKRGEFPRRPAFGLSSRVPSHSPASRMR